MAKGKSAGTGTRNSDRSNGKASKQNPGRKGHGSRRTRLDEGTKIRMGQGLFVRFERMNADGVRAMASKKGKKKD